MDRPWESPLTRAQEHARAIGLTLRPDVHIYEHKGTRVPNVTSILANVGITSYRWVKQYHLERGTAVHQAVHYSIENDLHRPSVDERIIGYVDAADSFMRQTGIEPRHVEAVLHCRRPSFAGCSDLIGDHRRSSRKCIVDWKSGLTPVPATGIQTALYGFGWQQMTGEKVGPRFAVHLRPDGTFRVHEYKDPADLTIGLSAVEIVNWKLAHGLASIDRLSDDDAWRFAVQRRADGTLGVVDHEHDRIAPLVLSLVNWKLQKKLLTADDLSRAA